jgi:arylsulfatase
MAAVIVPLILATGCGEDRSAVRPAALSSCINLIDRSEDALSVGVWSPPEDVRIAGFRVEALTKRCVRVPVGGRVELPAAPVVAGMELWLEVALDPESPPEAGLELRVAGHEVETGEAGRDRGSARADRALLDRRLEGRRDAERWQHVSIELPPELVGNLVLSLEADGEGPGAALVGDIVLVPGQGAYDGEQRPNALLITLDTVRADHLPPYGYPAETAPFLARLAEEMTVYERAYTPCTWTLPSHASLFTGLYPSQHRAITDRSELGGSPLPDSAVTLAELLAEQGYLTLGIASGPMLKRHFAVDQGFAWYSDDTRRADAVSDLALEWIDRAGDRPFLAFINYFDPHLPLDPPGYPGDDLGLFEALDIDVRTFQWSAMPGLGLDTLPSEVATAMLARYDAEICFMDAQIERLFEGLRGRGLLDKTVVCIVGDHGESYGESGIWGHGGPFRAEQSHVPLLYRDQRGPLERSTVAEPVTTSAVASMILSDLGIESSAPGFAPGPRAVYGERFTPRGSLRMLVDDRYLYLLLLGSREHGGGFSEKLFDLEADPEGLVDIAPQAAEPLQHMRLRFSEFMRETDVARGKQTALPASGPAGLTEEQRALRAELEALGYAGDG